MATFERREELRDTFDRAAPRYDEGRPAYPEVLFDDLAEVSGAPAGSRLLEIGAGSGIATRALAERGFAVVGVELSAEMARQARQSLSAFPAVSIITTSFEEFTDPEPFDGVVAFSSFHWLRADTRGEEVSAFLRPGGFLAVADARWSIDDDEFGKGFERDCELVLGDDVRKGGAPGITPLRDEMSQAGFTHLVERRYDWEATYSPGRFIALLSTLPWYLSLPTAARDQLFAMTEARIEALRDGVVATTFHAILDVAMKLAV